MALERPHVKRGGDSGYTSYRLPESQEAESGIGAGGHLEQWGVLRRGSGKPRDMWPGDSESVWFLIRRDMKWMQQHFGKAFSIRPGIVPRHRSGS